MLHLLVIVDQVAVMRNVGSFSLMFDVDESQLIIIIIIYKRCCVPGKSGKEALFGPWNQ